MNRVSQYLQVRSINVLGITLCLVGLVGLCFLSILAPYAIGYTAETVPAMQPVLTIAGFLVALFLGLALAEKLLLQFGEPPFMVSEQQRKWGFRIVAIIAIVAFAIVIDIPMIYATITDGDIGSVGEPTDIGDFFFLIVQPIYLLVVLFALKKRQFGRSWFLIMMLAAVFAGYLIQALTAELFFVALFLLSVIIFLAVGSIVFLPTAIIVHEQLR